MSRIEGRNNNELRPIRITRGYTQVPEGSVLMEIGKTMVLCTASIEERVPPFLKGSGKGWVTAEYSMLPRATGIRNQRESSKGKLTGRTMEIQRLIGRALRSVVDLTKLGERTIWLDCDVLQADGGTRTASITGAYVALNDAVSFLLGAGLLKTNPIVDSIAAISVGKVHGEYLLDLAYEEDSNAEVDMNVVMTGAGKLVEVQGTAEGEPFDRRELNELLDLAEEGIRNLMGYQRQSLESNRPIIS